MIQIYRLGNTDYEKNGDMTLFPITAEVKVMLNDAWEASLTHPVDKEGRWKYIEEDAVIKMPSFNGEQLFRIRKRDKTNSTVSCLMEPIFYDTIDDCFLEDIRPTQKNGQDALNSMLSPNRKYNAKSDIKKISTAYYQDVNFMEALNGNIDQSFVNRWGGEICYDNFTVMVNERIGENNHVELRYGKNIKSDGFSEEVDTRDIVTRIKPVAYNGRTMDGNCFVDSPNIDRYPTIRTRKMYFENVKMEEDVIESEEESDVIICKSQAELDATLRLKCEEQYSLGIDKPKVTITVDMILLQNTDCYKDFSSIESVSLGDTVYCIHNKFGISTEARVVSLTYDSIRKKVTNAVIGDYKNDYFSNVDSIVNRIKKAVNEDGSIAEESIRAVRAEAIRGGTLTFGGNDNKNGLCVIIDSEGKEIGLLDKNGFSINKMKVNDYFEANTGGIGKFVIHGNSLAGLKSNETIGFKIYYDEVDDKYYFQCDTVNANKIISGEHKHIFEVEGREICMDTYGMSGSFYGIVGYSEIGESGTSSVSIDETYAKIVDLVEYAVFLQGEGRGDIFLKEKTLTYFSVEGTPGTKFYYEIKARKEITNN